MKTVFLPAVLLAALGGAADTREPGRYAPVNGLRMFYEIHGVANDRTPPLILLHEGDEVERRGGLVEDQDRRVLQERPGDDERAA